MLGCRGSRQVTALAMMLTALVSSSGSLAAPPPANAPPAAAVPAPAPPPNTVLLGDVQVFRVEVGLGDITAAERAHVITARLARLVSDPLTRLDDVRVVVVGPVHEVRIDGHMVLTVTEADSVAAGTPVAALAAERVAALQTAIHKTRTVLEGGSLLTQLLLVLVATLVAIALFLLSNLGFRRLGRLLSDSVKRRLSNGLRVQQVELISADSVAGVVAGTIRLAHLAAVLILAYIYVATVLSVFPATQDVAPKLLEFAATPLVAFGQGLVSYLPNVFYITAIVLIVRYALKLVRLIFLGLESQRLRLAGFAPEWSLPTYRILRFLILALTAVIIFPYLPGSSSPAFQGIGVFLGVLFSFGSASAIGNLVAGIVITYMRPYSVGDRVRIAETTGDVMERSFLVTRVRTTKNEDVTIPNSLVLGSHMVNYTSACRDDGLILHTEVTIGYDVPWRQVHALLLDAARACENISDEPAPFILQRGLDDFYVRYELNAFTTAPRKMARTYGELHQRIQDGFAAAGVEILSPHYRAERDGTAPAIAAPWPPASSSA